MEGVDVLYVIRPKLVGTARNLPTGNPQVLAAVLYALAESETRTASGANTEPSAAAYGLVQMMELVRAQALERVHEPLEIATAHGSHLKRQHD